MNPFYRFLCSLILSGATLLSLHAQAVRVWRDGHVLYEAQSADSVVLGARLNPEVLTQHAYVDMGLSVLWATYNVGATQSHEPGDSFAWGETSARELFTEDNYQYGNAEQQERMTDASGYHYVVMNTARNADLGKDIASTEHDAARMLWGGDWRMPTLAELMELRTECRWEWTMLKGQEGYKVTANNGNYLFLPASADTQHPGASYWTSTASNEAGMAESLEFIPTFALLNCTPRFQGLFIRPVLPRVH